MLCELCLTTMYVHVIFPAFCFCWR